MFSRTMILSTAVVAATLASLVSTAPLAQRDAPSGTVTDKRVAYTDFTVGTTACGNNISGDDQSFYVGVDTSFGSDATCGRQVTITAPNGKQATGTVIDLGADNEGLNISPSLFQQFYNLDKGIFQGDYYFN